MLKYRVGWALLSSPPMLSVSFKDDPPLCTVVSFSSAIKALKLMSNQRAPTICCSARRRVRYDDDDEEYGYNGEIAMLELYSQSARGEALLVRATVNEEEVEVLIFKGFSSCLSYGTSPDPSKSIIPARAVIRSIDRIRGPFNPSNIDYIEKGLTLEAFKTRLQPN